MSLSLLFHILSVFKVDLTPIWTYMTFDACNLLYIYPISKFHFLIERGLKYGDSSYFSKKLFS